MTPTFSALLLCFAITPCRSRERLILAGACPQLRFRNVTYLIFCRDGLTLQGFQYRRQLRWTLSAATAATPPSPADGSRIQGFA